MFQSYENIDNFLETFPSIFSSFEAYTTVFRGIPWFCAPPPLRKLHKFKFTWLKKVSIFFFKRGFKGGGHKIPLHECSRTLLVL